MKKNIQINSFYDKFPEKEVTSEYMFIECAAAQQPEWPASDLFFQRCILNGTACRGSENDPALYPRLSCPVYIFDDKLLKRAGMLRKLMFCIDFQ